MANLIDVGQIVNTHGLRGEVKVNPWTDAPEVFEFFDRVFLKDETSFEVESVRYQKSCVLLKLSGIDNVDDAEKMRGKTLFADKSLFDELPRDTYLVADIVGLRVRDDSREYGAVTEVITTGSNDVYAVKGADGKFVYIPAIRDVIKEINIKGGYITVDIPKGLLD